MAGEQTQLVARHDAGDEMTPYERLLGDAMRGDASLFTRADCVEAAWRVIEPILEYPPPLAEYDLHTWGPDAADRIIAPGRWHNPVVQAAP
jgi:glucose-6-phosphate 1-dehydrogenase